MAARQRKIILIFTRDFSQWLNQLLRDQIVNNIPKVWGRGLEDQIVHYTGRSAEWYRYEDDYLALADFMTHKSLADRIFSESVQQEFRAGVRRLRGYIATPPPFGTDLAALLEQITNAGNAIYPFYTLAVFMPGAWRDRFMTVHGDGGREVLDRLLVSREQSEGVFKLADNFLRAALAPGMEARGYEADWVKLLSIPETEKFAKAGELPPREILAARSGGYVYIGGEIIPASNFDAFLSERNLTRDEESIPTTPSFRGTVANAGGIIRGVVKTIFNTAEVSSFPSGCILVTPMTSPEYLPAMKKAIAIVTDEGGVTCHAAITSRELGIPCVIGAKIATRVLRDGDVVEVDSRQGIIKKVS